MTPVLDISDLAVSFRTSQGPSRVLDHVNLSIEPGEIVGLVGESGCGKTTLARAILGTLAEREAVIGSGHIRIDGIDMLRGGEAAQRARGRTVTVVPQDSYLSFNPLFRVGTQIADLMRWTAPIHEGGRFRGSRRLNEEKALAMLAAVQLPQPRKILAKYPHQLSGGQRQRVMIAMALLPQPRIIIADEPTSALDATVQAQILGLLRRVAVEQGVAILFATHNLGAAWEICDRIMVMYAGQIVEAAPRNAFFSNPRHPYSRGLLASLPEFGRDLAGIPGEVPDPLLPAPGCSFGPRCSRASDICRNARPAFREDDPGHLVACHHPWTAEHPFAYL
ncbi:ABC transporter ATP-binding protein [Mesorhizobium sp. CN2-181]|uniref:ABC transporter ATP-binding protein n=1 Tax=Mesorhizobium yinganensis TaxID=3157707 RepID=UPI0032B79C9A